MGGELIGGGKMSMKRMRRKVEVWCISIEVCVSFILLLGAFGSIESVFYRLGKKTS